VPTGIVAVELVAPSIIGEAVVAGIGDVDPVGGRVGGYCLDAGFRGGVRLAEGTGCQKKSCYQRFSERNEGAAASERHEDCGNVIPAAQVM